MKDSATLAKQLDGRDIMLAVAAGVPGAFDELVRTYELRVRAGIRRYISDSRSVEDLSQEVFLRLFRARRRYTPSARFETFLYRIILNLCVNHSQYSRRRRTVFLDQGNDERGDEDAALIDPRTPSPIEAIISAEQDAIVRQAVDRLPCNQRIAVLLSRFSGLAHDEVARALGISPEAVKSLLWRARENLRMLLRPHVGPELAF